MSRWKLLILPALAKLGFWGLGLIALVDAASLPVPMDLILTGYVWADKAHLWLYVLVASAGSAIGGLIPYALGRAGGEIFLLKRVDRERFEKMRLRFEQQEFFAVMVPSMLPPPTPWKAFVFAAGVFEMRVLPFVLAVFSGRIVRWTILSLLVLKLGPGAVSLTGRVIHDHLGVFLGALSLVFGAIGFWAWQKRRKGRD
uniref:VTT domain-containing protein n=1 Tax=mine drainage metagenome TaxID=410659 RepID=E6QMQ3_9ZZZZ